VSSLNDFEEKQEWGHVHCDMCGVDDAELLFEKKSFKHVRCRQCGMVYVNPRLQNTMEKQQDFYDGFINASGSIEEAINEDYRGARRKRLRAEAKSYLSYNKTGHIMDLGCGFGAFLKASNEEGWEHPEGIEVIPQMAAYVQKIFPVKTKPLEDEQYDANLFDVVRLNNVIEHLPSPMALVKAVYHILRPGGLFVISTPNFNSFSVAMCGPDWQYIGGDDHIYLFTPTTLKCLLENNGFRVVKMKTKGLHLVPRNANTRSYTFFVQLSIKGLRVMERLFDRLVRYTLKGHRLKVWAEKI
jgi:2-polyprenyl-3-methyl-5-hydroxy-6-metoxy-1,4-benzoquinol methylase